MMCCILFSASVIGAKQCSAPHKQFAVLRQFSPTLLIIWAQVAVKRVGKIQDGVPLKLEKNIQHLNTEALAID